MAVYIESAFGEWKLPLGTSHVGRGVDCTIRLDDLRLSRHHAELIFDGNTLQIKDLGSMNGILVNGDRIADLSELTDGAQITLGPFSFSVRFAADEKDPSRVASEALAQQQAPERKPSNDFTPSTDRSSKRTVDFDEPMSTPIPIADQAITPKKAGDAASPALTQRKMNSNQSGERRIAPLIEKALKDDEASLTRSAALDPNTSVLAQKKNETDTLFPSQQGARKKSDALQPIGENGQVLTHAESDLIMTPLAVELTRTGSRLGAIVGDTIIVLSLTMLCLLFGLAGGIALASQTGAAFNMNASNWQAEFLRLHQAGNLPWLSFLSCIALSLMVACTASIYLVIGGKSLSGGAWCHRKLGLVLIDQRSGHFPHPMRCLLHTLLGVLTAPLTPILLIIGQPTLSDRLCRCMVGRLSR